jgi:hypothetical protein
MTFLCGVGGSIAVEVVQLLQVYEREPIRFPERYKRWGFYVLRTLLALAAGALAVVHGVYDKPLLAVNIGASAPLILQALARGLEKNQVLAISRAKR